MTCRTVGKCDVGGLFAYSCPVTSPSPVGRLVQRILLGTLGVLAVLGMASVMLWPGDIGVQAQEPMAAATPIAQPATDANARSQDVVEETLDGVAPAPAVVVEQPKKPKKPKKPKAATRERKAKNVPDAPLDGNTGRRIVYDKTLMTVWLVNKKDEIVGRFPVVGRWDRPVKGEYKIYSKSPKSGNPNSRVTFNYMTRFAYGNDGKTPIGFHDIPRYYDGRMMHSKDQLGLPVATGGCIRMAAKDAEQLYEWSKIGDRVIVLPSP
jgi:lipoprotein-anchoring transpeptidase ErfK/SrfK